MGQVPFDEEAGFEPQHEPASSGRDCSPSGITVAGCKARLFVLSASLTDVEQQQPERAALAVAFVACEWSFI
jgi:hypothetical protein